MQWQFEFVVATAALIGVWAVSVIRSVWISRFILLVVLACGSAALLLSGRVR
jgi:hypothetical protein